MEKQKLTTYTRAFVVLGGGLSLFLTLFFLLIYLGAKWAGPPPINVPQTTMFYDSDNNIISKQHKGEDRVWISLDNISPSIIDGTIATEDKSFYSHHGFDFKRIAGALLADLKAMSKVQGASTITQQYARNLYLEHDKTWKRKVMEAVYTVRLEVNYSKKEILEGYLNTIYYGHGRYGVETASQLYFGKSAQDLTLSEASLLVGIPKGPTYYSPYVSMKRAKERQTLILKGMEASDFITPQQEQEAEQAPLALKPYTKKDTGTIAPYFQDEVKNELQTRVGMDEATIEKGGLHVYTTLNLSMQQLAEDKITAVIPTKTTLQGAFVAMDPASGEVKALVGGRNYQASPFNRATQALRQPGSTFKPFLYYYALQNGFTPATKLKSEATTFLYDDNGRTYNPKNYNNYYANDFITMAEALALSDNIYAVKTELFFGVDTLVETAKKFGITTKLTPFPSLTLGSSPVKPIEMVNAYGMLANGGHDITPTFIKRILDDDGNVLYDAHVDEKQVLDKDTAFILTEMMTGMFNSKLNDYTSVTGQSISKQLTRPYAGKSGSTNTDSWMIGFTPQLVSGVWIGYDQSKQLETKEEQGYSKHIWSSFMEDALKSEDVQAFAPTDNVVGVDANPHNGTLGTDGCPSVIKMYFLKGTEPTEYCTNNGPSKKDDKQTKWYEHWLPWK